MSCWCCGDIWFLKTFTQAIHPSTQASFFSYDHQQTSKRESKGTGVFIPRSTSNPRRKNVKQPRFMASGNKFQRPCDHNSIPLAHNNSMINPSYDHSFNFRRFWSWLIIIYMVLIVFKKCWCIIQIRSKREDWFRSLLIDENICIFVWEKEKVSVKCLSVLSVVVRVLLINYYSIYIYIYSISWLLIQPLVSFFLVSNV